MNTFCCGIELPVSFCSPKDGKFLSNPHSHYDCTIALSSNRCNDEVKFFLSFKFNHYIETHCDFDQVFTLVMSAPRNSLTDLVHIRTSQRLYMSLGSSAWLIKQTVKLQRTIALEASILLKQTEVRETVLIHAETEKRGRERIDQLELALNELRQKPVGNSYDNEREQQARENTALTFQKQLSSARSEYNQASMPWQDAVKQADDLQQKLEATAFMKQQISEFGCDCLDIERPLGAFLKPTEWKIHKSDRG